MPKDTDDRNAVDIAYLNSDIAELANDAKAVAEKAGELRAAIKQKIEDRGYNKKALGMLRSIAALSDDKLADFRRTFDAGLPEITRANSRPG